MFQDEKEVLKLFPYQEEGAFWLSKRKLALLADEMGLGKTPQAIRASDLIQAQNVLVVCPAIARINWSREFEKFSEVKRSIEIISFDMASKLKVEKRFDVLIIDEAHYLKSPNTKRSAALYGINGLVRKADRVWALTGTPAPNHAAELWTHLFTFGITKLSYSQFVEKFCTTFKGNYGLQITGTKMNAIPELQKLLSQIMLRRKKENVMKELPSLHYAHVVVPRGEVDIEVSDAFIKYVNNPEKLKEKLEAEQALVKYILENEGTSIQGMRSLEALASSVSTLRRYNGLQKLDPIVEILKDELEQKAYEKVVIFAIHKDTIEGFRSRLEKYGSLTLYGGMDDYKKQKNIDLFQKGKRHRVMVANIQAAGTAITLTAANQVVFAEQDWVPGNNAQAVMRCHRIGQTRPVYVRVFGLAESVDERISNSLKRKMNALTRIFDLPSSQETEKIELNKIKHGYTNELTINDGELEELLK